MDYETWYFLQTNPGMKVVNTVVLISLIYHALIGIWTVITDYIKITWLKMLAEIIANLSLLACFLYGLYTLLVVI
jgi:succinate dehydrogenase / fumarate reductase membrane anchor subunit